MCQVCSGFDLCALPGIVSVSTVTITAAYLRALVISSCGAVVAFWRGIPASNHSANVHPAPCHDGTRGDCGPSLLGRIVGGSQQPAVVIPATWGVGSL